ncbi:hypothetical protein ALC56_12806, partial [Trachymyrmex septentrionalis]
ASQIANFSILIHTKQTYPFVGLFGCNLHAEYHMKWNSKGIQREALPEISLSGKHSVDKYSDNLFLRHALVYSRQPRRSRNRFHDGACASMMSYARSKFIDL